LKEIAGLVTPDTLLRRLFALMSRVTIWRGTTKASTTS
jgi:hypothetical protein